MRLAGIEPAISDFHRRRVCPFATATKMLPLWRPPRRNSTVSPTVKLKWHKSPKSSRILYDKAVTNPSLDWENAGNFLVIRW